MCYSGGKKNLNKKIINIKLLETYWTLLTCFVRWYIIFIVYFSSNNIHRSIPMFFITALLCISLKNVSKSFLWIVDALIEQPKVFVAVFSMNPSGMFVLFVVCLREKFEFGPRSLMFVLFGASFYGKKIERMVWFQESCPSKSETLEEKNRSKGFLFGRGCFSAIERIRKRPDFAKWFETHKILLKHLLGKSETW